MLIEQGKHKARVKNYAVRAVKSGVNAGQPAPTIAFVTTEGDHTVYWQGSFSEKARKFTLEALYHCGLTSAQMLPALADGPPGGALNMDLEVEIEVVHETVVSPDGGTKTYAKAAWVNPVGGAAFKDTMSKNEFSIFVSTLGLQGELLEIARKNGVTPATTKPAPAQLGADIPF